jgi:hypothetical protein
MSIIVVLAICEDMGCDCIVDQGNFFTLFDLDNIIFKTGIGHMDLVWTRGSRTTTASDQNAEECDNAQYNADAHSFFHRTCSPKNQMQE